MSRKHVIFVVLYPLIICLAALVLPTFLHRSPRERSAPKRESAGPEQAVSAYWTAEDESHAALYEMPMVATYKGRVSEQMWSECTSADYHYKDRIVEGKTQLGDDRWEITATAWSTKDDEKPAHIAYIVTKEKGKWVVDEIRLQCPKCKGEKQVICTVCDGQGKRKADYSVYSGWSYKTCDNCNGTGKEECFLCKGKGYLKLKPGNSPFFPASKSP